VSYLLGERVSEDSVIRILVQIGLLGLGLSMLLRLLALLGLLGSQVSSGFLV
jgi:hypothetical protein